MKNNIQLSFILLVVCGFLAGIVADRSWQTGLVPRVAAQGRAAPLPTMESLPAEVAQLKLLVPSNSHIMMDVQWMWTNLYFAGQKRNWPLANYFYSEARGHITWLIRKNPILQVGQGADRQDVDIKSIFDAIDTSSMAAVKTAIDHKNVTEFNAAYKTMLESCYSCHKSAGRPYIRPQIPTAQAQSILNMDPNATWPQ